MKQMFSRAFCALVACSLVGMGSPSTTAQTFTSMPNQVYGTFVDGNGQTQNLLLDLFLPTSGASPHPVVIWIHGGGWVGGSRVPVPTQATNLCARGYAVASIDYRLSGQAIWPAQIQDCKGAIRWLRANAATFGLDKDRFGVWGSSAGGHLVAFLGTSGGVGTARFGSASFDIEGSTGGNLGESSRVQAVVDFFGPTDFLLMRDFPTFDHELATSPESMLLGGAIQDVPERAASADSISYLTRDDPHLLIMHGTIDTTVPYNQSELLHDAATLQEGTGATFFPIQNNGHGGPGFSSVQATALIDAYLDERLLNAPVARVSVAAADSIGDESGDLISFVVSRTGSTTDALRVRLAWSGQARAAFDYAILPSQIVVPAGSASVNIDVAPFDDGLVEGAESVVLDIAPSLEYRIDVDAQRATASIVDDEVAAGLPVVTITAFDAVGAEGPGNPAAFQIVRTGSLAASLIVRYRTNGRAVNGVDYLPLSGSATIAAGAVTALIVVIPLNDPIIEPSETVFVEVENDATYVVGAANQAGVRIVDNDRLANVTTVSVIRTDLDVGEAGANGGAITLTRTLGVNQPLNVNLQVTGTAINGVDYAPIALQATFAAGSNFVTVPVNVLGDSLAEGNETVTIGVSPGPGIQIASAPRRSVTIADDDVPQNTVPLILDMTPLDLGEILTVSIADAAPGAIVGLAAAIGEGFAAVPPFGGVGLDLASAIIVGAGVADGDGSNSLYFAVPNDPNLLGIDLFFQAFAYDIPSATGALSAVVPRRCR